LRGCQQGQVGNRLLGYAARKRVGEPNGLFQNRKIAYEVVELTSRVGTDKVAEAKRRLNPAFSEKEHVDVSPTIRLISAVPRPCSCSWWTTPIFSSFALHRQGRNRVHWVGTQAAQRALVVAASRQAAGPVQAQGKVD